MPIVTVEGDDSAQAIPEGASQEEGESVVQSWQRVAVLKVAPDIEVYIGFIAGEHAQLLNTPIQRQDGQFGVRVGDGEVKFFVLPKDLKTRVELELVQVTNTNDDKFPQLPLY